MSDVSTSNVGRVNAAGSTMHLCHVTHTMCGIVCHNAHVPGCKQGEQSLKTMHVNLDFRPKRCAMHPDLQPKSGDNCTCSISRYLKDSISKVKTYLSSSLGLCINVIDDCSCLSISSSSGSGACVASALGASLGLGRSISPGISTGALSLGSCGSRCILQREGGKDQSRYTSLSGWYVQGHVQQAVTGDTEHQPQMPTSR